MSNATPKRDGPTRHIFVTGGVISSLGKGIAAASLGRDGTSTRYFLGSPSTANHVRVLVGKGLGYAEVLATLQEGTS